MRLNAKTMMVVSAPYGDELTRVVEEVNSEIEAAMTLNVTLGIGYDDKPLMGQLDFIANRHVPLGTSTRCRLQGKSGGREVAVTLYFDSAEIRRGEVRVLD